METLALDRPDAWTEQGWARWLAHVRPKVARKPPKKYISRPLFPRREAERDRATLLGAICSFVYRYGFWPRSEELVAKLRADKGAVIHYLLEFENEGLAVIARGHLRTWSLTQLGWSALGIQPIEPWNAHPRSRIKRIARRVAVDLYDMESAALAAEANEDV